MAQLLILELGNRTPHMEPFGMNYPLYESSKMRGIKLILFCIVAVLLSSCTIARVGQITDGKRWVWIAGIPSHVEAEGVAVDNRILSIALDRLEVDR